MINEGLRESQQLKRNDSIEKVKWAVQYLQDTEGSNCRITALKLSNISGLSRAALYKNHLRPIWDKKFEVHQAETTEKLKAEFQQYEIKKLEEKIVLLEGQLKKSQNQISRLTQDLETEKSRSKVYRLDLDSLNEKHQALLFYNLRIMCYC